MQPLRKTLRLSRPTFTNNLFKTTFVRRRVRLRLLSRTAMGALDIALHILLSENPAYRNIPFPDNTEEKRMLLRTLQNVRPPYPVNEDFLKAQDAELQRQMAEKGIVALSDIEPCRKDRRLRLWQGDITRLQVDAIVNAANSALLGCFVPMHRCIDNAIHSAAGVQLRLACDRLMQEQEHPEPTGRAKITDGYNLPARYVLHTVGPIVRNDVLTPKQEQELADCYNSCLALADAHGLQSIAFCCISTGEFGFPKRRAADIAVGTVRTYLDTIASTHINTVIFNVFKDDDLSIYRNLLS